MRIEPEPARSPVAGRVLDRAVGGNGHAAPNGQVPTANGRHVNGHGELHLVDVSRELARATKWDDFLPARAHTWRWRVGQGVKRALDALLASAALVVLSPFLLLVALLVRLTSPGPVLYVCDYVGLRGRRFPGYKFRTMVVDAEARKAELAHLNHMRGPAFKIRGDPRTTPIGRFLRKYSIDELPQLWNVVRGDMSLVGPRPPLPTEWEEYEPWQRGKLAVLPGITCFWQINGRSEIVDFDDWARLDLEYIQRWSLWTDLKILVRTVPAVLKGHGAY